MYKLQKALYGLKQAPWAWYIKLSSSLTSWGFKQSRDDSFIFIFQSGVNMLIVLIYVDDILLIGINSQLIANLISTLHSQFAPNFFLEIFIFFLVLKPIEHKILFILVRRSTY